MAKTNTLDESKPDVDIAESVDTVMSENIVDSDVKLGDDREVVLSVDHVAKSFRLPTEQASGIKQALINWTKGIKGYKEQRVLRDVSFKVRKGDFFGIVGRNGSGKSTLLKLISKIYVPEKGRITVKGKLVPFIELGVGFNPELTGRENVYLNGALLGFSREEIDDMYDDIVHFAELEDFMDQKLKNYSSGMQVRLAFSVAIKAQGDILVLDEVLAVGDEAFQRKCDNFFKKIKQDPNKTVILVTHDMGSVRKYCNKAILIKDGEIIVNGDKDEVADRYTLENFKPLEGAGTKDDSQDAEKLESTEVPVEKKPEYPSGLSARVPRLKVWPVSPQVCKYDEPFRFDVEYEFNEHQNFYLAIAMHDVKRGGVAFDTGSVKINQAGHHRARFEMPLEAFNNSEFKLVVSLRIDDPEDLNGDTQMIAFTNEDNTCTFVVRDTRNTDWALVSERAMQADYLGVDQPEPNKVPLEPIVEDNVH